MQMARLTSDYAMECPRCQTVFTTPEGLNPHSGKVERMVLDCWGWYQCKCGEVFSVTQEDARKHNHHYYPDDPHFFEETDDAKASHDKV